MAYSLADKLYANKPYTKIVQVFGMQVEFQRLSARDAEEISRSASAESVFGLMEARRIPTLARAVKSIDDVPWRDFDEIKQHLRSNPGMTLPQAVEAELRSPEKYSDDVVQALHMAYVDFASEYRSTLEGLKKTSAPPNPATAG